MEPISIVLIILYSVNIFSIIGLIFFEKRNYNSLLVWLLVLVLLPIVGFLIYSLIGKGPSIGKNKKFLHKIDTDDEYYREVELQKKILYSEIKLGEEATRLAYYNLSQQGSILTDNNSVEIMTDIEVMYQTLFNDISAAEEYINILFFIIKNDEYGKALKDILIKKAKEGLKVRFLYDYIGAYDLTPSYMRELKKAGVNVHGFLPSIFKIIFRNVNYRNHRKIAVIDGKIAYTGGANIGKEYVNKSKRIKPWHDTQIRIKGDAVTLINLRFMQDYNFTINDNESIPFVQQQNNDNKIMQIVSSGPDSKYEKIKSSYIKAIYDAKKCVYIQTPYFIPDETFQLALITASKSGVDVRIMIPGVPDKKYAYLVTTHYMQELLPHGIKFYMWKGFIHSKTLIVDDEIVSIGTFNIDIRSFKLHFEMTAFIFNKEINEEMKCRFNNDITNSTLIPSDYKATIWRRTLESIMRLFTPLM